jgi:hypothetical protein
MYVLQNFFFEKNAEKCIACVGAQLFRAGNIYDIGSCELFFYLLNLKVQGGFHLEDYLDLEQLFGRVYAPHPKEGLNK